MILKQVSVVEAKEILKSDAALLFDIRDKESYTEDHAQEAIHLTSEALADFLSSADRHHPIMVMCYHGISSLQVAQMFIDEGFDDVYSIEGGYEAWQQHKHRAEK